MHRFLIAPALACAALGSAASFAANYESAFPYEVRAAAGDVPLRCGPGEAFYATELLDRGRLLTVYRQTPGGWLAVRPTESSYSLLASRYVRETNQQDVFEVVDDHAVSWVGSTAGQPPEFKWQVRLEPGERVVVLGEETCRTFPDGPRELHYKIAPPAGEFRWIHEQDVRHASQVKIEEPARQGDIQLTNFRVAVEEVEELDDNPPRDGFVARRSQTTSNDALVKDQGAAVDRGAVDRGASDRGASDRGASDRRFRDRGDEDRGDSERSPRRATRDRATPQGELPPLNAEQFEKRFRDLDVRLSLMVAKPIEAWQLDTLGDEVSDLIAGGGTTVNRGRALLLAEKVDEFEQLYARYQTIGANASLASAAAAPAQTETKRPPSPAGVDPRFDGAGWLYPVHSQNQAAPPYALLDADGTILQFVSPAPGLNLNRYLRKEIGVFGQHSAVSSLDKPHVTAQRVVGLERLRR